MGRRLLLCGLHLLVLLALAAPTTAARDAVPGRPAEHTALPPAGDWNVPLPAVQDRAFGQTMERGLLPLADNGAVSPSLDADWVLERVDSPHSFERSGNRSLALDGSGYPHIAYGAEHLYYAWYDGASWRIETVDPAWGAGRYTSLALDAAGRPHISYRAVGYGLRYAHDDGSGWQIETVDPAGSSYTSLALDAAGRPGISYYTGVLKYAHLDGTAWVTETVDSAGDVGFHNALAIDGELPRIAYYDADNGDLKYAAFGGSAWQIETVPTTWYSGLHASLALDSAGRPHITFCRSANHGICDFLDYARYDGSAWQIEQVGDEAGMYTSLVLDANDHPHVTFLDWYNYYPKYAYHDGASWHIETVDTGGAGSWYTSLALDPAGHPHVSYYRVYATTAAKALRHAYNAGAGWQIEAADPGGDAGQYNSLVLDSAGRPHISYMSGGPYYDLRYAQFDGTTWVTETVDSAGQVGEWTSLALDSADRPHISYYDQSHNALKYARYDGATWISMTVDMNLGEYGGYTSLALDAAGRPHIAYRDYQNARLKYAHHDGSVWIIEIVVSGGSYPALALDAAGRPHISYVASGLQYAYYDGTSWQYQTVDSAGSDYNSLVLDSAGDPAIAYHIWHARSAGYMLKYARYDGAVWQYEIVDAVGGGGGNMSLALDSNGHPHIGYFDVIGSDALLAYARHDGTQWQLSTVDNDANRRLSMALDSSDLPYISYYNSEEGDLKHAYIAECLPITGVTVDGPPVMSAGHTGLYTATFTPPTATLPLWMWDNGTVGPTAAYSWTLPGEYALTVTATNACAEVTATLPVSVYCQPVEEVTVRGPRWVPLLYGATYRASAAPITASLPLAWQWDNGVAGPTAVYSWTVAGSYTLAVTATNLCGALGSTYTVSAYCQPAVSTDFSWQPGQPLARQPVTLTAYQRAEENGWYTATMDGTGGASSLALDAAGRPHIAYYSDDYALRYAYHDGSTWHLTTVDGSGSMWDASLALDSAGRPHISYYDGSNGRVKYAYYDGAAWQIGVVEIVNNVVNTSLALDAAGRPHIAYGTFVWMGGTLRYAWYDGSAWQVEVLENGPGNRFPALALDAAGRPHIAYNGENYALRYAYFDGSTWAFETVTGPSSAYLDLALDAAGRPHIVFAEYPSQQLQYVHHDGTRWITETLSGGSNTNVSLALDGEGHPHLSYGNGTLQHAAFDGIGWYAETVDGALDMGAGNSIALDSQDAPHISYIGALGLRYARWIGPTTPPITYTWDLGEGTPATGPVVGHFYSLPGTYTVVLTGTNCGGVDSVVTHTVIVVPPCAPVHDATFFWDPPVPTALFPLTLTAAASGTAPISFTWNLGDGAHGSGPVVTHTYGTPGVYTVVLTASNCTTATATVVHTITVAPCLPVMDADFAWAPLTPTAGLPFTLTAWASGTLPIAYTWDLGDGRLGEGTVVGHVYDFSGTYTVTLTATNCAGDIDTAAHALDVSARCEPVHVANFAWSPPTPTAEVDVTFTARADAGGWITDTLFPGGQRTRYRALVMDGFGRPHIIYDNLTLGLLEYARWDGTTWIVSSIPSSADYGGLSMDVDPAGRPHISFQDWLDMRLKYAYLDDVGWVVTTVDDDVGHYGTTSSLKVDAAGRPHISYNDTSLYWELHYAYYDGTSWVTMTVDSGESGSSLGLDSLGRPHIAYTVAGDIRHASYNGTAWQIETVADAAYAWSVALELDRLDRPHISYADVSGNRVLWAVRRSASWEIETAAEAVYVGGTPALAVDAGNEPRLAYADWSSATLYYAWRGRDGWQIEAIEPLGESEIGPVGMALDRYDRPHLAYTGSSDVVRHAQLDPRAPALPISYTWNLGDGMLAAGQTVHHIYGQPGSYTVTLTATNCVDETRVRVHRVEVAPCLEVSEADFYWRPRPPVAGELVILVGETWTAQHRRPTPPVSYTWDLGDGTREVGDVILHTYAETGTFTVVMTATNCAGGMASAIHTVTVVAAPCTPVSEVSFTWMPLTPTAGQPVTLTGRVNEGGWYSETIESAGGGRWPALALDGTGRARVAYFNLYSGTLRYAHNLGEGWQIETVDSNLGSNGGYASLALDAAGRPHVSYADSTQHALKYAYHDGTVWHIEFVAQNSNLVAAYTSLALDAAGRPHVSYIDQYNGTLMYAYRDDVSWQIEWVGYGNLGTSLALDTADRPHVSYWNYGLLYAWHDGSSWQTETVDNYLGRFPALALDPINRPHISYYAAGSLRYARYDGSAWMTETVDSAGYMSSVVLDIAGRPHISYAAATPGPLKYAYNDGATWQIETIDAQATNNVRSSLALDPTGRPRIAYGGHTDAEVRYAALLSPPTSPVYTWNLGDSTRAEGQSVQHSYALPGDYTVFLTATNCAAAAATTMHTLTVSCGPAHDADFAWAPLTPTAGLPLTLTAWATGTLPITYTWEFGDGIMGSGVTATHVYTAPGTYAVTLTAANCGTEPATAVHNLTVAAPPCAAVEILTVTTAISECTAAFGAGLSGTPPFAYLWTFAGGAYTATHPVVDFGATGTYTGALEVWNCGSAGHDARAFTVAVECTPLGWKVYLPLVLRGGDR